jgi:hypothetical protein
MVMKVFDPDEYNLLEALNFDLLVRAANCAGGASRSMLCLGDSTTAAGKYTQRLLDLSDAHADNLVLTLKGTQGDSPNLHEGVGGFKTIDWYQPGDGGVLALNPFVETLGGKFDAAYYLSNTSQTAWHATLIHLGINDIFYEVSDGSVHGAMDAAIQMWREIIGITSASDVGSILETNGGAKFFIAVTIPPVGDQDGFGNYSYLDVQTRARYRRNQMIASYRIVQAFRGMEDDGIILLPWNSCVDPVHGFAFAAAAAANANTTDMVSRHDNGVHPNPSALGGYEQMGDAAYDAYSVAIAEYGW